MNRKAQIRMGETIAVLIIFFFLLILGAIFFLNVQKGKMSVETLKYVAQEGIKISQVISSFPELQCASNNIIEDNCFDIFKLNISAGNVITNTQYYYSLFRYSEIVVEEIFPTKRIWSIYNNTLNTSVPTYTWIPVLLYNATSKQNSFGVLSVAYYPYYGKI